jgi:hypothetical protein
MDELRISNTVRDFDLPPIMKNVSTYPNQPKKSSYPVKAQIQTYPNNKLVSSSLHYRIDRGTWQQKNLSQTDSIRYEASIPGQPIGSTIEYYLQAETESGMVVTEPSGARSDSIYHSFAVWQDSSTVLALDFDKGEGIPEDQSEYQNEVNFYSQNDQPTYTRGDEGSQDKALMFNAFDSTMLEIPSPILEAKNFGLDFKFYFKDSLPAPDTRILAKGSPSELFRSTYQVSFNKEGNVRPAIYSKENSLSPCGSYMGSCLEMNEHQDGKLEPGNWYRMQLGMRAPDTVQSQVTEGVVINNIIHLEADTLVSSKVYSTNAGATLNPHPLMIGGTGGQTPYFSGVIDDIKLINYLPNSFLPDRICPSPSSRVQCQSIDEGGSVPGQVKLQQNYPNPFNPTTNIRFQLPRATSVKLTVYNTVGRRVATLVDRQMRAGRHTAAFNGSRLTSGVYFYRLETDRYSKTRKMLLLK